MIDYEGHLRKENWEVGDVDFKFAQHLVREHHYARGGSNTFVYLHGLFHIETGGCAGLVWWLPPTRVACESVNKEQWQKVLSLTRMVMVPSAPKSSVSFLLSRSVKLIKQDRRFVSLVTYADESQEHKGECYKVSGWTYAGRTGPYPRWVDSTGKQVACKATVNRVRAKMEALGYIKQGSFYKHKYVKHLA